jgi:Holliday junction resolvase
MSQYGYGRRKELQVGEFLERRGFHWRRAPGSRGSIDLLAENGEIRCGIQIKATRKDLISYARLTIDSERRLLMIGKEEGSRKQGRRVRSQQSTRAS